MTTEPCDVPEPRNRQALPTRVPVLRAALMRQRDFRREQLAQLADEASGRTASPPAGRGAAGDTAPAVREVQALVEAGALRALDEIELALIRIRTGDYGRCRACGADIPLAVLEAIPQTTLCLFCHRLSDDADGRVRAAHPPTRAVSAR